MNSKTGITIASLLGTALVSLWLGKTLFSQEAVQVPQSSVPKVPFTANLKKRFFSSDNDSQPAEMNITYARKADGSFVNQIDTESPTGEKGKLIEIWDKQRSYNVVLETFTKSKITYQYSPSKFAKTISSLQDATCQASEKASKLENSLITFAGHHQNHRVVTVDVNTGESMTTDELFVPELDCFVTRSSVKRSDGAKNETIVQSLQEGSPNEFYFTIPNDYVERSPLEVEKLYSEKFSGTGFFGSSAAKRLNNTYQRLRASIDR